MSYQLGPDSMLQIRGKFNWEVYKQNFMENPNSLHQGWRNEASAENLKIKFWLLFSRKLTRKRSLIFKKTPGVKFI